MNNPPSTNTKAENSFIVCIINGAQELTCTVPDLNTPTCTVTAALLQNINLHTPIYDPHSHQQTLFHLNCFVMLSKNATSSSLMSSSNTNSTLTELSSSLVTDILPLRVCLYIDSIRYEVGTLHRAAQPIIVNHFFDHYPERITFEASMVRDELSTVVASSSSVDVMMPSLLLADQNNNNTNNNKDMCAASVTSLCSSTSSLSNATAATALDMNNNNNNSGSPESKLVSDIYDILWNDPFGGSIPSTHIQSSVMHSPAYLDVLELYDQKWHPFLRAHPDVFYIFKYTAEDIRRHRFFHTCHANEARVALVCRKQTTITADVQREVRRRQLEEKVFQYLHTFLQEYGECDSHVILKELEKNCVEFQEITHPSYHVLERIIRMNEGTTFTVRDEPRKGLFVSLK